MPKVKLTKLTLAGDELRKLTPKQKKRYLMVWSFLRDNNLLYKLLSFVETKPKPDAHLLATATMSTFFVVTIIGKLYEIHRFYSDDGVYDECADGSDGLRERAEACRAFFADERIEGLFKFIRDKLSFHYDTWTDIEPKVDDALVELGTIRFWLSEGSSGNEMSDMGSSVILAVILGEMKELGIASTREEMMEKLMDLPLQISKSLQEFSRQYSSEGFDVKYEQHETVELEVPSIQEVKIPLIVGDARRE